MVCIYSMIEEGRSVFWEVIASVIARKKISWELVSNSEWLVTQSCMNVRIQMPFSGNK